MKIISTGKNDENEFPIRIECEYCGSELEIDKEDLDVGPFGAMFFTCPVCGKRCMADDVDGITLTEDNIEFPKHFYCFKDGIDLTSEEIKKYIKDAIKFFRNNPSCFCYSTGSGNTSVIVLNFSGDEEYVVNVAKGYYEAYIPYGDKDYAIHNANNWEWENVGVKHRNKEGER